MEQLTLWPLGEGCLRVWVNLQLREVNAHSLEGPGEVGSRGLWVQGVRGQNRKGAHPRHPAPPTPSQVASASEGRHLLLANDGVRPGRGVLATERGGESGRERGLEFRSRLSWLIKNKMK